LNPSPLTQSSTLTKPKIPQTKKHPYEQNAHERPWVVIP